MLVALIGHAWDEFFVLKSWRDGNGRILVNFVYEQRIIICRGEVFLVDWS